MEFFIKNNKKETGRFFKRWYEIVAFVAVIIGFILQIYSKVSTT